MPVRSLFHTLCVCLFSGLEGKRFPIDISVSQSALQIQSPDSCDKLHLPQEVKLVPSTCRYVQHVSGEGLHVRMKAHVDYKTGTGSIKEEFKTDY